MKKKKPKGTKKGYTTGACSAAAAKAATLGIVNGKVPESVVCTLPNGENISFQINESSFVNGVAHAMTIKDAGDDPDCTHLAPITAHVKSLTDNVGKVILKGGEGVGTITMRGLGLDVGSPAINPVPRKNIEENVRAVASDLLETRGLEVTISVFGGEKMATKTLNYRLGIIGGISILGTTGIVHPYSTAAFRASVIQGIEVAANQGQDTVVLTTGGRTEKFVIRELTHLESACFIQMGDFLKYALDTVVKENIQHVVIGGMVGKLTKMAQGETVTHAGRNAVNTDLLADMAKCAGAPPDVCEEIRDAETARFASERMEDLGLLSEFYQELGQRVIETLSGRYPGLFSLQILICDFDGNKLADIKSAVR